MPTQMNSWLSWMGPAAVVASVAYAYVANHPSVAAVEGHAAYRFPLSTVSYCGFLFFVYASGTMPRNPLFPKFVFNPNIFSLLYKMYCTYTIGYRVLRHFMHQPAAYPHSDYRSGIRCIDAGSRLSLNSAPPGTQRKDPFLTRFYARAGGVVDTALWNGSIVRGVVVVPIPMFADNYAYLIVSMQTHKVAAVDPADPEMVLRIMQSLRAQLRVPLQLTEVLTTHKHWDHAGGNEILANCAKREMPVSSHKDGSVDCAPNIPLVNPLVRFIGSEKDAPLCCNLLVNENSPVFEIMGGAGKVQVMAAPGHTEGSLVFVVGSAEEGVVTASPPRVAVFTGDSLFCGGCGAPFETASVTQIMKVRATFLDDRRMRTQPGTGQEVAEEDVLLYVGHEYTERLLTEVGTLMAGVIRGNPSCDPRGKQYVHQVSEALHGVKMLRAESDGLADAANMGQKTDRQKPSFRLPLCTMPSSLMVERAVNPLLTVDEDVLAELVKAEEGSSMDSNEVERAIYCTDRRCLPSPTT